MHFILKGPFSINNDKASFTELFRFHLVDAAFAFGHIFANIPVAEFMTYVFTAASVLMKDEG